MIKMNKKNLLIAALSLFLVAAIAVGGTLAYFTSTSGEAVNTFTAGNIEIGLTDVTDPAEGEKGGTSTDTGITYDPVQPGDKLSKIVSVNVAEGSQDCWMAIKVAVTATPAEGSNLTPAQAVAAVSALVKAQVDAEKWLCVENGSDLYYYYKTMGTAPNAYNLFSRIEIPAEWGNDYAGINFDLTVQAAAVQAANLEAPAVGNVTVDQLNALFAQA